MISCDEQLELSFTSCAAKIFAKVCLFRTRNVPRDAEGVRTRGNYLVCCVSQVEWLGHVSDERWACLCSSSERKSILAFRVHERHERRIIWWQRTSTSVGVPMITERTSAACPVKGRDEMRRQSTWVATGWKVTADINHQSRAKGPRRGTSNTDQGVLAVDHSSSHRIPLASSCVFHLSPSCLLLEPSAFDVEKQFRPLRSSLLIDQYPGSGRPVIFAQITSPRGD